jgi:Mrp family chromosome partitioning ATPase
MSRSDLITVTEPRSPASEAYRTLRTNLEFSSLDHPLHSLLVTCPGASADKSITLANLAVIMAEGGRKVILVDGDLRRPALHEIFGLDNAVGLSDLIGQDGDLSALPLEESGVEGLRVLTSGPLPQNPSVLLGSDRMERVISALVEQADLVGCASGWHFVDRSRGQHPARPCAASQGFAGKGECPSRWSGFDQRGVG